MANVDRMGFVPVGTVSGGPWTAGVRLYPVVAGAGDIFVGDFVTLEADGYVDVVAANTTALLGVMIGRQPDGVPDGGQLFLDTANVVSLETKYSSGAGQILVACAPDTIFEGQCDGISLRANIGACTNIVATAGSTTTGMSKHEIDQSDMATASTDSQLRIIDYSKRVDNEVTATDVKLHVTMCRPMLGEASAGV